MRKWLLAIACLIAGTALAAALSPSQQIILFGGNSSASGSGGGGGAGCSATSLVFTTPCNSMYVPIVH